MSEFQFPLHRDPRCNLNIHVSLIDADTGFSSLYIGILAATFAGLRITAGVVGFSSLYIGILAATDSPQCKLKKVPQFQFPLHRDPRCNTEPSKDDIEATKVSVPFTSGSSLQRERASHIKELIKSFSSLYIGILAATKHQQRHLGSSRRFSSLYIGILAATELVRNRYEDGRKFQFPLHRDPRCNYVTHHTGQPLRKFQFPLHRDPRCNSLTFLLALVSINVSVPFTSGSSLQRARVR